MGEPELCDVCSKAARDIAAGAGLWLTCGAPEGYSCLDMLHAYRAGLEAAERMAREREEMWDDSAQDAYSRGLDYEEENVRSAECESLADAIRAVREGGDRE